MGISVVGRIFGRSVKLCGRTMSSSSGEKEKAASASASRISPWLMLRPHFKSRGEMDYGFYSVEEKKIVKIPKRGGGEEGEVPDNACKIVGSSHGWLALFNESNNDLFVSDPINRRHIKLPRIDSLPDPEINLKNGRGRVSKLILSCSADEEDCRAMMSFGAGERVAVCSPGRSTEWTPIGRLLFNTENNYSNDARVYEDFVYCSSRKVFTCMTPFNVEVGPRSLHLHKDNHECEREDWEYRDIHPKRVRSFEVDKYPDLAPTPTWAEKSSEILNKYCVQVGHLVYAEDQLFMVIRFVMYGLGAMPFPIPDDPSLIHDFPVDLAYNTVGFLVFKVDDDDENMENYLTAVNSLDGLAMFVGINHSFAISASELNLKPNSIYFTDAGGGNGSRINGGHDIGIFDYHKGVISPCYNFPTSIHSSRRIPHPPLWFTPSFN